MEIPQNVIAILTGLIGVLCGTSLSSYFNLKSSRKDLLFKRKLEYFERLARDVEDNCRLYKKSILSLSHRTHKNVIKGLVGELKKNRKNFLLAASPLYFDVERITGTVTRFVGIEKDIFALFENLLATGVSLSKDRIIFELHGLLQKLEQAKQLVIREMRGELYR